MNELMRRPDEVGGLSDLAFRELAGAVGGIGAIHRAVATRAFSGAGPAGRPAPACARRDLGPRLWAAARRRLAPRPGKRGRSRPPVAHHRARAVHNGAVDRADPTHRPGKLAGRPGRSALPPRPDAFMSSFMTPQYARASGRLHDHAGRVRARAGHRRRGRPSWIPPRGIATLGRNDRSEPRLYRQQGPVFARLARIEGQVSGVARMVEDDRYFIDVLTETGRAGGARQGRAGLSTGTRATACSTNRRARTVPTSSWGPSGDSCGAAGPEPTGHAHEHHGITPTPSWTALDVSR